MLDSISAQASSRDVEFCASTQHRSINLSVKGPCPAPQKAAAISRPADSDSSYLSFDTVLLAGSFVSWVSAQITIPSSHLNPARIVTASLLGSRLDGTTGGLDFIHTPPGRFCEVNNHDR